MATISREFKRTRATRVVDGEPKTRFVYTRDQNGNKVALNRPGFDGGSVYWFPTPVGEACLAA